MSRHRFLIALAAIVVSLPESEARADAAPPNGILEGRVVEAEAMAGIEGATLVVTDGGGGPLVMTAHSDAEGRFTFVLPGGTYDMMAIFGEARWMHRGLVVKDNQITQVPAVLALDPEVVTIHEKLPTSAPPQIAEVNRSSVKLILPYSDEAILEDLWSVVWLLLDIDDQGTVTSFRFVHRAGHGLDEIAEKEAWTLRFSPARDKTGTAVASQLLWKFEWPSFHYTKNVEIFGAAGPAARERPFETDYNAWQRAHLAPLPTGQDDRPGPRPRTRVPNRTREWENLPHAFWNGRTPRPPCRGSGPLNLDTHQPLYRDCSPPQLEVLSTEKAIVRPAENERRNPEE